jgi:hypothetical protein
MKLDREGTMRRAVCFMAAIVTLSSVALLFVGQAQAADLNVNKRHVSRSDYGQSGRRTHRSAYYGCPDRVSCYPLYGAYGPYGGVAYWGAYSYGYDSYR